MTTKKGTKSMLKPEGDIIASCPIVHEPELLPHRIEIRDLGGQYVVHTQVLEPGKKPWYHQGDYFPKGTGAPSAHESDAESLRKAWTRFEERVRRSLNVEPLPARRLAEFSDIAESVINALMPDDEDDRRDMIEADYQLESDIDTFEQLTGKVIQPGNDPTTLGGELDAKKIEQSS
jgi:hypothetical protein